jgi:hypothetical protein
VRRDLWFFGSCVIARLLRWAAGFALRYDAIDVSTDGWPATAESISGGAAVTRPITNTETAKTRDTADIILFMRHFLVLHCHVAVELNDRINLMGQSCKTLWCK